MKNRKTGESMRIVRETCLMCETKLPENRTVYCSIECHIKRTREIAHSKIHLRRTKQVPKSCQVCFKVFTPIKSTQINCSKECGEISTRNWHKSRAKVLKDIECHICSRVFKQKNLFHKNCSPKCREIDFREKNREREKLRRKAKKDKVEVKRARFITGVKVKVNKAVLRSEVINATERFLKAGNKIVRLPDSPASKVPSVGIRGVFGDEREFYTEASEGNIDPDLLEMEDNELAAL